MTALAASSDDARFNEVPETVSAIMSFPQDRLASFTVCFGSADTGSYKVVGTKGELLAEPAYGYAGELKHRVTVGGKRRKDFREARSVRSPELIRFSPPRSGGIGA